MALLPLQSSYFSSKPHPYVYKSLSSFTSKPKSTIIISQDSSQSSKPTIEEQSTSGNKQALSSGQGFGSGSGSAQLPKSKKQKGRKIIRRSPVERPAFLDKKGEDEAKQQKTVNESAFLLTWLGFGALILLQGITLAASGFLPEKWDKFLVNYLYPSFTPTVFVFVAGTVVYGVFKYLQNENLRNQK